MSLEVARVQRDGGRLMVEAPTGTGKSVSYLVPSIERAQAGERVMVVTAGIALQEQLIRKDLPLLREVLPEPFTFAIAKGLNNYLCANSFEDADGEYRMVGFREDHEREQWPVIQQWAADTATGDVSELPFEIDGRIRLKVTTTSDECLGQSCPKVGGCLAREARKVARGAQIVVTNYHLFFADMSAKANDPEAGPLPAYRHVVADESHELAEIARDFFGFRVSPHSVRRAGRYLQGNAQLGIPQCADKTLKQELGRMTDAFFQTLERAAKHPSYKGRIEGPGLFDAEPLNAVLRKVSAAYGDAMLTMSPLTERAGVTALGIGIDRLSAIRDQLSLAALNQDGDRFVYFIDRDPSAVSMKPIDVAPMLRKHLFEREGVKSVSMCSATLASSQNEGERFEYFASEFGCSPVTELAVDSPFDFSHQCLLYLPRQMREPNHPDFHRDVSSTFLDVANAAGGRTLGLFTSFKVLREVRAFLERMHVPWRVLAQGDAPRSRLVQQFKDDEQSVLLGCDSFWQGVDVPGPALSAVVIDKIPFPHHDDPVMGAIQQRDKQWFANRALPQACIAIKQGFGRLIRDAADRGVVAIVDPRITGKGYGKKIERSLPAGLPRTRDLADVQRFFTPT